MTELTFDSADIRKKTNELREKITALRESYKAEAQAAFKEATKSFFDVSPMVAGLNWLQYTPYWNDGEECHFNVHDIGYWLTSEDVDDIDAYEGGGFSTWNNQYKDTDEYRADPKGVEETIANFDAIQKFINSIDNDTMQDMFGDHVRVMITRDGVTTDEWDHE